MIWTQVYDPFGVWWLSTIVAALPVVVLLGLLGHLSRQAALGCDGGGRCSAVCRESCFHMPWKLSIASLGYGAAFGLLKIAWIVVAAVFLIGPASGARGCLS